MKKLVIMAVLLAACAGPADRERASESSPERPPTATSSVPQEPEAQHDPAAQQEPAARPEIEIDTVSAGNPLVVRGTARTFENAVTVRVRDEEGQLIGEAHVTSRGDSGHHNPFEASVWLTRAPGRKVTVEAFEFSAKDGSIRSLATKSISWNVEPIDVTLVFPAQDCTRFVRVQRRVPKTPAMARLIVESLLSGPTQQEAAKGATSAFPQGAAVRSVILRDGVITVDFNERLQNVGGSCAATAIRESVTSTLQLLPAVKKVVITAGGSETLALQP